VLLAAVTELGHHARLESPDGRRVQLYPGDEIIVAYGARYAPDQFEAVVPDAVGPCDLVAGGGIAARVVARHASTKKATTIVPIGVLTDIAGDALHLRRFVPAQYVRRSSRADQIVAVVGTSMNAGKTTSAANLIRGLAAGGLKVGACKITGTGSGGDIWSMRDAGAAIALDFTDVGYATTAGADLKELEASAHLLIDRVLAHGVDLVVVEIADGLLQRETAALLSSARTANRLDAVLLAAADSMGAVMGASWLRERGLPLRAVTGLLTSSPLATREAQQQLDIEVVPTRTLLNSTEAARLCHRSPFIPLGALS
jgi:dethiobiotin synthetase